MLSENGGTGGFYMPVAPAYDGNGFGNDGFGGDWGWIILLLLFAGGGWGNGFGGGFANGYEFPWLMNGQQAINSNTNDGFQNALLNDSINSVRDGVTSLSSQLCNTGNDIQMAMANGFAGVEQGANSRQMANMQTAFAGQTAMAQGFNGVQSQLAKCCSDNKAATQDVKYTIATEACANRATSTANTQAILDKLCQLELDGVKAQVDAKNDRIADLTNQLTLANLAASQTAQTAQILQGQNQEVDALYNRLNNCPVPTTPVYGRTPIFTCSQNQGCGCGNF